MSHGNASKAGAFASICCFAVAMMTRSIWQTACWFQSEIAVEKTPSPAAGSSAITAAL